MIEASIVVWAISVIGIWLTRDRWRWPRGAEIPSKNGFAPLREGQKTEDQLIWRTVNYRSPWNRFARMPTAWRMYSNEGLELMEVEAKKGVYHLHIHAICCGRFFTLLDAQRAGEQLAPLALATKVNVAKSIARGVMMGREE